MSTRATGWQAKYSRNGQPRYRTGSCRLRREQALEHQRDVLRCQCRQVSRGYRARPDVPSTNQAIREQERNHP